MVLVIGVVTGLLLLVAAVWVVGMLLPVKHVCARSAVYRQPPQAVWALISEPQGYPSWRKDVKAVEILPPVERRLRWRETGGEGLLTFELLESEPGKRMVIRIADKSLPFGGTWTFDLVPDGNGCRLSIRENGEIYNVIFRFMARFVMGYHRTVDTFLRSIGRRFGESTRPEAAPTWG